MSNTYDEKNFTLTGSGIFSTFISLFNFTNSGPGGQNIPNGIVYISCMILYRDSSDQVGMVSAIDQGFRCNSGSVTALGTQVKINSRGQSNFSNASYDLGVSGSSIILNVSYGSASPGNTTHEVIMRSYLLS